MQNGAPPRVAWVHFGRSVRYSISPRDEMRRNSWAMLLSRKFYTLAPSGYAANGRGLVADDPDMTWAHLEWPMLPQSLGNCIGFTLDTTSSSLQCAGLIIVILESDQPHSHPCVAPRSLAVCRYWPPVHNLPIRRLGPLFLCLHGSPLSCPQVGGEGDRGYHDNDRGSGCCFISCPNIDPTFGCRLIFLAGRGVQGAIGWYAGGVVQWECFVGF